MHIEKLPLEATILGEAPHWDDSNQTLYYVDIFSQNLMRYTPKTGKFGKVSVAPKHPSFIIPVEDQENYFMVSLDNEVAIIYWDGESDNFTIREIICTINDTPNNTFNDGKCDSNGRLWAGTIALCQKDFTKSPPVGSLFSIDSLKRVKSHVKAVSISNGLAFNYNLRKFYYIDSLKATIDVFDFNLELGCIDNRKVIFTLSKHNIPGLPDGMTIDSDGNLWVAIFAGSRIIKINGLTPEILLATINLPAEQITSAIWGGQNFDELYVTSGCCEQAGRKPFSQSDGCLFKISDIGARGLPEFKYRMES